MPGKKVIIGLILALLTVSALLKTLSTTEFNITGHFEGFYLLRDKGKGSYEVTDHLFVGKEQRIIFGTTLTAPWFRKLRALLPDHQEYGPHLHLDWNPKDGSGYVDNRLADGTSLVTYFGRYLDNDKEVHGLFVGGGLPETVAQNVIYNMNNSGVTFYNGKFWYHIWCSVNEGISFAGPEPAVTPSRWKFLGSKVISRSSNDVVITSSHAVTAANVPLRIERLASFRAGEPYFSLEIRIINAGNAPVEYIYSYGDEPWVGYYGTALGDVGWLPDRLVTHEEVIDSRRYSYAGMADIGNPAIGERPVYSKLANFIEWIGADRPKVYFSNDGNSPEDRPVKAPLESNERFIGLQWYRLLLPGDTQVIRLNIGMASLSPRTGRPIKPPTSWR